MTAPADRVPTDRYRPAVRPDVLVSDEFLLGARSVHLVKNPRSGKSYEVGVKEHFLMARMDGTRGLDELGAEYAAEYGKRLGDANWQRLLGMLGVRGLLEGGPAAPPAETAGTAGTADEPAKRTLLRGTLPLVADADATADRLHRAVGFLLATPFMVPLLLLITAMEVVAVARLGELVDGASALFTNPVLLAGVAALLWFSTALHELAHGVVARRYGGQVAEIGLRWRLPVVIMYCTVDNYLYLRTRWHRIATAVAGAVMNLAVLLPFCAVWVFVPVDDATGEALAGLLLLGSVQALAMLVPFPPLDGYKIAAQLCGATALAASSREYVRLAVRRDPAAKAYPRRARTAYLGYTAGSLLALAGIVAAVVALVVHLVAD
ncbi:site-2 protease family protein [Streptomyces sp. IB2014 016-6]|uniref:metalloprotease n=1 Tax=Streptomyces sp. IB2014 016-6 TaxID=2517818 RepID=UPI0011CC4A42|nr:site-2 protease family protein [Streptomyces sp. IB2014 016-6]TXL86832.1 M50 family peptidase [Streptomyces sp. IB2014 016-6]